MKDNNVECLFSRLFLNNGLIITFIIKINFKNVIIFPSESMKRACSNSKSKQIEKRICREPATICILHDCEDFNDCDNFAPLNATKVSPEENFTNCKTYEIKRNTATDN